MWWCLCVVAWWCRGSVVVMVCFVLWCCSGAVVFVWWCCVVRDGVVLCHCGEGGVVRFFFCGGVDACVVVVL